MSKYTIYLALLICTSLMLPSIGAGQDYFYSSEMDVEQYQQELDTWQSKMRQLQMKKEQMLREIDWLQEQISNTKHEIAQIRQATLELLSALVNLPPYQYNREGQTGSLSETPYRNNSL